MPREGVTIYDLLLSCPGDVIDLIDIVKECVEDFNRVHGKANNVKIEIKHWSTDEQLLLLNTSFETIMGQVPLIAEETINKLQVQS